LAISREKKEKFVEEYSKHVNRSEAIIITANNGLKVNEIEALRGKIREAEGKFFIVKNTLAQHSLQAANLPTVEDMFKGSTGVGFCHHNVSGVAKAITEFAKQNDRLVIKGGLLGNKVLNEADIKNLANLPSLNELRSQIIGLINAPARNLVGVVASSVRQVINVINAYAEKDKNAAEEAITTESTDS